MSAECIFGIIKFFEAKIEIDIEKDYEAKPIVIVANEDQRKNMRELAKKNKWRIIDSSQANF